MKPDTGVGFCQNYQGRKVGQDHILAQPGKVISMRFCQSDKSSADKVEAITGKISNKNKDRSLHDIDIPSPFTFNSLKQLVTVDIQIIQ
ncbi:MAG: hypothetical protein GX811_13715 [Lentisphaerae bacterium]|nr:hypothetical protein [Lentisphaerota bacterium]